MSYEVIAIPAFDTNYIWAIVNKDTRCCAVVDPGDAAVVIDFLNTQQLTLAAILITHHHYDHTGGLLSLRQQYDAPVYGPDNPAITGIDHCLHEAQQIKLDDIGIELSVLEVPGHTLDHIAYYNDRLLFCGDTLFSAGCGRMFEGNPQQFYQSLQKLKQLPDTTLVYCAHEYTINNLEFALTVEPDNQAIKQHLEQCKKQRQQHNITLPSTIALEKKINPFLRCDQLKPEAPVVHFKSIRERKDKF